MMNQKELNPIDVLGGLIHTNPENKTSNSVNNGYTVRRRAEILEGISSPRTILKNIPLVRFGEVLRKACQLNSIIKRHPNTDSKMEYVMKDRIGVRQRKDIYNIVKKNTLYATDESALIMLDQLHVDLLCNRKRRVILQDFVTLKTNFMNSFSDLLASLVTNNVPDNTIISDVFDISTSSPKGGRYTSRTMGYLKLNARAIPKEDITITATNNEFGLFNINNIDVLLPYVTKHITALTDFDISINMKHEVRDQASNIELLSIKLVSNPVTFRRSSEKPHIAYIAEPSNYDVQGLDISGIVTMFTDGYTKLQAEFCEGLTELENRYQSEIVLYDLLNDKGAL